ncbi:dTDP-glucose 4,6-dehydratase [Ignicoccus pacificus DSM 13166]|uniref:dTDP-glucose 4,6-dehydratase n=1 Tax=Ignicoccus pacificus DSM 13166 TaxID=940294 RepID=A0A977K9P0_9CREN|nr:dTDP-glucose 4,6-dehydratase [Ignicoccus pacificus DSM 13166]
MRIVVTGGAGFMGSNLVEYLVNQGHEVVVFDKFTYAANINNLKEVLDKISIRKVDIADKEALMKAFDEVKPERVFHLAAETHVDRSYKYPEVFVRTNVQGTINMLEAARKFDFELIVTSTDEVYGDRWGKPPCDEECKLDPTNPYSASKATADMFINAYFKSYGINVKVVRPSNNYGPRQYPEKLIPRTIFRILNNLPPQIHGTGEQLRDWLYVKDFCEGIVTVAEKGVKGEIYNMPAGNERSVLEVVKTILRIMGKPEDWIEFLPDRPYQDRRYAMKGDKIRSLGWKPKTPFEEGMRKTVKWYLEKGREWWDKQNIEQEIKSAPTHR